MSSTKRISLLVSLCLAAAAVSFLFTYKVRSQSQLAARRPFIAQIVEKHFLAKNSAAPGAVDYSTFARRSDGSEVTIRLVKSPDGELAQHREFTDFVARKRVTMEPFTSSVSTYYFLPSQSFSGIEPGELCPPSSSDPTAERSQLLGYEVVRVVEVNPGHKDEKESIDQWVAPALNCFPLFETASLSSGPHNERQVTTLIEGEPPDSMLVVPPEYIERSPSQVAAAYAAKFPGHAFVSKETAEILNRSYYAHRKGQ